MYAVYRILSINIRQTNTKFSKKRTRLTAAFGNAALRYISYRFNWSSEKLDTRTLQKWQKITV